MPGQYDKPIGTNYTDKVNRYSKSNQILKNEFLICIVKKYDFFAMRQASG